PSSFAIGWSPVSRSMIERRRAASAAVPSANSPELSGPRWTSVALIRATRSGSTEPFADTTPQIPHMAKESRRGVGSTRALHDPRPADPAGAAGRARCAVDRRAEVPDPVSDLPGPGRARTRVRARDADDHAAAGGCARRGPAAPALPLRLSDVVARPS